MRSSIVLLLACAAVLATCTGERGLMEAGIRRGPVPLFRPAPRSREQQQHRASIPMETMNPCRGRRAGSSTNPQSLAMQGRRWWTTPPSRPPPSGALSSRPPRQLQRSRPPLRAGTRRLRRKPLPKLRPLGTAPPSQKLRCAFRSWWPRSPEFWSQELDRPASPLAGHRRCRRQLLRPGAGRCPGCLSGRRRYRDRAGSEPGVGRQRGPQLPQVWQRQCCRPGPLQRGQQLGHFCRPSQQPGLLRCCFC